MNKFPQANRTNNNTHKDMSFHPVSKRFSANIERLPRPVRQMIIASQKRGVLPAILSNLDDVPDDRRFQTMEEWKFMPGDKVMITKGKFKGTVTKIAEHNKSYNGYFLEESETRKVVIPTVFWRMTQPSHVIDYPNAVTRDHLKLVGTITNEKTGATKTFAANDIVYRGKYWDERYKKMLPHRCVKNAEHITIPWPAPLPIQDDALCTPESKALERTYFPTSIVHSGLPADLKQSLRSPLAKRRIPRYQKHIIDKFDLKRLSYPEMPEPAHKELMREEKKMLADRSLKFTPEMEDFIGKRVADHLSKIQNPHMKAYLDRVGGDKKINDSK